jgi:hypothetical protein
MKLVNTTPNQVMITIECSSSVDCGTIDPGGSSDWPYYDNQENVLVAFSPLPSNPPPEATPFKITIPDTRTGMAVTIGLSQE